MASSSSEAQRRFAVPVRRFLRPQSNPKGNISKLDFKNATRVQNGKTNASKIKYEDKDVTEDEKEDELTSYDFEHLLVGNDPKVEMAIYDCYCGEGFVTRKEFKKHLEEVNYEAVKNWAEGMEENTEKKTIGEGMKTVFGICDKIRHQKLEEVDRLKNEKQELEQRFLQVCAKKDKQIEELKELLKNTRGGNGNEMKPNFGNESEQINDLERELRVTKLEKNWEIQDLREDKDAVIYRKDLEIKMLKEKLQQLEQSKNCEQPKCNLS